MQELLRRPKTRIDFTVVWRPTDTLTLSATGLYVGAGSTAPRFLGPAPDRRPLLHPRSRRRIRGDQDPHRLRPDR